MKKIGLTLQQQRDIYQDGFVVLSNIIPQEMVNAARREINMNLGDVRAGAMGRAELSQLNSSKEFATGSNGVAETLVTGNGLCLKMAHV